MNICSPSSSGLGEGIPLAWGSCVKEVNSSTPLVYKVDDCTSTCELIDTKYIIFDTMMMMMMCAYAASIVVVDPHVDQVHL